MGSGENIKQIISLHERRLQKFREQEAVQGLATPPQILIEIEDIEAKIEALQAELKGRRGPTHPHRPGKATILFVDNDLDFLRTRSEFLERNGYHLLLASEPLEAKWIVRRRQPDLVILDLRLVNDDDDKDLTGLNVAKACNPQLPKIILTRFPSFEAVREALRPALDDPPPVTDFIAKQEGPGALLTAVKLALLKRETSF